MFNLVYSIILWACPLFVMLDYPKGVFWSLAIIASSFSHATFSMLDLRHWRVAAGATRNLYISAGALSGGVVCLMLTLILPNTSNSFTQKHSKFSLCFVSVFSCLAFPFIEVMNYPLVSQLMMQPPVVMFYLSFIIKFDLTGVMGFSTLPDREYILGGTTFSSMTWAASIMNALGLAFGSKLYSIYKQFKGEVVQPLGAYEALLTWSTLRGAITLTISIKHLLESTSSTVFIMAWNFVNVWLAVVLGIFIYRDFQNLF